MIHLPDEGWTGGFRCRGRQLTVAERILVVALLLCAYPLPGAAQDPPSAPQPQPTDIGGAPVAQKEPYSTAKPGSCRALRRSPPENAPIEPLTSGGKFKLAACDFLNPFTYIIALGDSSISTAIDAHSAYGPGVRGISKRFGVDMTDELSDDFFGTYFYPSLFRQDPHYHRIGPGFSKTHRVFYAMSRALVASSDRGGRHMINTGEILGTITTSTLANTYHPGITQGFANTSARVSISIGSDAVYNIWKEYAPEFTDKMKLRFSLVRRVVQHINFEER